MIRRPGVGHPAAAKMARSTVAEEEGLSGDSVGGSFRQAW